MWPRHPSSFSGSRFDADLSTISQVSPPILAAVVFSPQFWPDMVVTDRRRPYFMAANKFVLNTNLNLILIAEMIEPILGGSILLSAVRQPWNRYHAGINHLPYLGRKTVLTPKLVPRLKKFFAPSCRSELWSEKPDGLGLRHCIVKTQSQNRQKRNAILDLKLKLKTGVAGVQNHNLEPESNIKRLSAGIGLWLLVSNGR